MSTSTRSTQLLRSGRVIVLHIIQALRGGGAQTLVRELVPRLRSRGVDARVLCAYGSSQLTAGEMDAWKDIVYCESRSGVPRIRFLANLQRRLWQIRPQLVNTHTHVGSVWGRAAAILAGVPAIVHTEHSSMESLPMVERAALSILNRRTDAVVVFSERTAELLRRREKIQRPEVIPNGIQIRPAPTSSDRQGAREKLALEPDRVAIGVITSLEPYKNPHLVIKSIVHLSEPTRRSVRFAFFGDGSLRTDLEARATELKLNDVVRFYGFRHDLNELLPGLDLVLSTSDAEMMPMSYLESMNAGLPIIGTPHSGTLDLVVNGKTGIILSAWRSEEVAAAIEWAVARPEWRSRAGDAARRRVREKFDIEHVVERYISLYGEVLNGKLADGKKAETGYALGAEQRLGY